MNKILSKNKGLTLIELLVAMVISAILIAAIYQTFMRQQKTYTVQEQVVDMQQSLRGATSKMMRDFRMAGFGNVSMVLPVQFEVPVGGGTITRTYNNILNPDQPSNGWLTLVTAVSSISQTATLKEPSSSDQITGGGMLIVDRLEDDQGDEIFDLENKKYISIGGVESHTIGAIMEEKKIITLQEPLIYSHPAGTRVYPIRAVSYLLGRDENLGGGKQPLAGGIEKVQYEYYDASGTKILNPEVIANAKNIRMIRVTVTAKTDLKDPEYKVGDGYRRREIASFIQIRNIQYMQSNK